MVPVSQVTNGVMNYAEAEILPKLDGWQQFTGGAALVLLSRRINGLIGEFVTSKAATALGIADSDGNIDIDAAADALKESARKHGKLKLDLSAFGKFTFDERDIDALHKYIEEAPA